MKSELSERLGKNIRKYRLAQSMTQEHIAERLDLTTKYYASTERGEKQLSLDKLVQLLDVLGITPNDLFQFGDNPAVFNRETYKTKIDEILGEFSTADQYAAAIVILKTLSGLRT
jgi:transcriptional regulator with XRE-family HTH domain